MTPGFAYGPDVSFQSEQAAIDRRRKLAEALQTQGMQPIQSSRPDAPISWTQGLAQMLNAYAGKKKMGEVEQQQRDLATKQEDRRNADMGLLVQALRGREAQPAGLSEDASGNVTPSDPIAAQSPVQSLGQAIPMMGPGMQPVALNAMMGAQQRQDQQEFQRQQLADARQGRIADFNLRSSEQEAAQRRQQEFINNQNRQAAVDRAALFRMQQDARPQPQPQIIQTADGPMVLGNNSKATPVTGPDGKPVRPSQGRVGPMTATAQKELIETEEAIQGGQAALSLFAQARELNDKAMGFTGAGAVASAGSLLPGFVRPEAVDDTQNLDNILQTAALPQLKAIFGGMPTEGERKILLDVQGSSSKPPKVRKEIFDRAEKAINARLKFGSEKAKRLREGTYFSGDGIPSIQMSDGDNRDQNDRRSSPRSGRTVVVDY